jgi:hypothetical protein
MFSDSECYDYVGVFVFLSAICTTSQNQAAAAAAAVFMATTRWTLSTRLPRLALCSNMQTMALQSTLHLNEKAVLLMLPLKTQTAPAIPF